MSRTETTTGTGAAAARGAATLLRGGMPGTRVWRVLGGESTATGELRQVTDHLEAGADVPTALAAADGPEWRVLAAAWSIAEVTGAAFAPVLERLADALVALERLAERRAVLVSGPRATIRLVAALPLLSLLLGVILGFDPIGVFLSPIGAVIAVAGSALLALGVRWAHLLTARLADAAWVAGLECELTWIAISAGSSPADAMRRVVDHADAARAEWVRFAELRRNGAVSRVLRAAARAGTPAGALLLAEADAARARAMTELETAAEQLGVRMLLPIAACVLPSFVLLGVVPVLIAVLGSLQLAA